MLPFHVGLATWHLSASLSWLRWPVCIVLEAIGVVLSAAALLASLVLIVCHHLAPRRFTQGNLFLFRMLGGIGWIPLLLY